MKAVKNPSEMFLAERQSGVSGSAVFPSMEGTRPILVEVQALAANATFEHTSKFVMEASDHLSIQTASTSDVDVVVSYLDQTL